MSPTRPSDSDDDESDPLSCAPVPQLSFVSSDFPQPYQLPSVWQAEALWRRQSIAQERYKAVYAMLPLWL